MFEEPQPEPLAQTTKVGLVHGVTPLVLVAWVRCRADPLAGVAGEVTGMVGGDVDQHLKAGGVVRPDSGRVYQVAGQRRQRARGTYDQRAQRPQRKGEEIARWREAHGGSLDPLVQAIDDCPFVARRVALLQALASACPRHAHCTPRIISTSRSRQRSGGWPPGRRSLTTAASRC